MHSSPFYSGLGVLQIGHLVCARLWDGLASRLGASASVADCDAGDDERANANSRAHGAGRINAVTVFHGSGHPDADVDALLCCRTGADACAIADEDAFLYGHGSGDVNADFLHGRWILHGVGHWWRQHDPGNLAPLLRRRPRRRPRRERRRAGWKKWIVAASDVAPLGVGRPHAPCAFFLLGSAGESDCAVDWLWVLWVVVVEVVVEENFEEGVCH